MVIAMSEAKSTNNKSGDSPPKPRVLNVTGRAALSVEPDQATVTISVETQRKDAHEAMSDNAVISTRTVSEIKALLGKDDTIQTTSYKLEPVYEYNKTTKNSELYGYKASNSVTVLTRGLDALGGIIGAATTSGANRVSRLSFGSSRKDAHERLALKKAVKDAIAAAETVAKAAGVGLKQILQIDPYPNDRAALDSAYETVSTFEESAPPIEAGDITVSATVNITYEIE